MSVAVIPRACFWSICNKFIDRAVQEQYIKVHNTKLVSPPVWFRLKQVLPYTDLKQWSEIQGARVNDKHCYVSWKLGPELDMSDT